MGEPFRMSIPLVSTKDDISKNFLLSGGAKGETQGWIGLLTRQP